MLTGAPFEELVKSKAPDVGEFTSYTSTPDMLLALKAGKTDAMLTNNAIGQLAVNRDSGIALFPQSLQDGVYERQSRKRYPEYYKEREAQSGYAGSEAENDKTSAASFAKTPESETARKADQNTDNNPNDNKEKSMLEDKGSIPFERIPENRKAVQYETKHQDDQRADGSIARSDHDGVR